MVRDSTLNNTNSSIGINIPVVAVKSSEYSKEPSSNSVIPIPPMVKSKNETNNESSGFSSSSSSSSSSLISTNTSKSNSKSVSNTIITSTTTILPEKMSTSNISKINSQIMENEKIDFLKNDTNNNLLSRRSVESTKYSIVESEMDSKFPDIRKAFSKDGIQEVRVAFIFIIICLIVVIGFSIRKYRKLRKAGEQVRNITNTVFPVKIVSLYLYIFLNFPLTVFMQFMSCITPIGFGMYNVVQSIYQSSCFIWLWDLFVEYFGGSEQIVTAIRRTGPYNVWKVPPFMINTNSETYFQPKVVIISYILVIQYLPISIFVSIINAIHPSRANLYNILLLISLTIAIYGLMLIYWPSKEALQPYQGGWKFGVVIIQSFIIIVIDSIIRFAKYENREYNSIVYKLYWRMMLISGISTICTLAAVAIIDSREIYKIYNLSVPTKGPEDSENNLESKGMLET